RAVWLANASEVAWVYRRRGHHLGPRHWREYGHVQRNQFRAVPFAAFSKSRPVDGGVEEHVKRFAERILHSSIPRVAPTRGTHRAYGCVFGCSEVARKQRCAGASFWRTVQLRFAIHSRRAADERKIFLAAGRHAGSSAGGVAQPHALGNAVWIAANFGSGD